MKKATKDEIFFQRICCFRFIWKFKIQLIFHFILYFCYSKNILRFVRIESICQFNWFVSIHRQRYIKILSNIFPSAESKCKNDSFHLRNMIWNKFYYQFEFRFAVQWRRAGRIWNWIFTIIYVCNYVYGKINNENPKEKTKLKMVFHFNFGFSCVRDRLSSKIFSFAYAECMWYTKTWALSTAFSLVFPSSTYRKQTTTTSMYENINMIVKITALTALVEHIVDATK